MSKIFSLFTSLFLLFFTQVQAQISPSAVEQARTELQRRGISEDEVRERLQQRGIDIDNIRPEQLPSLQKTLEDVIKEIEVEKKRGKAAKKNATKDEYEVTTDSSFIGSDELPEEQLRRKEGDETIMEGTIKNPNDTSRISRTTQSKDVKNGNSQKPKKNLVDTGIPIDTIIYSKRTAIYGQQIFRNKSIKTFSLAKDAKAPDTYIIGSGDELIVSIFGPSQFDRKFIVNSEGYITPDQMPKIFLRGVPYGKARDLVRSRFAQFYLFRPDQFSMSLSTARTITVNVFGELMNYGSYTMPANNTALNAIVAAGGPTDLGSVRNIQLVRGKTAQRLDLYEFISNPGVLGDFNLQENDIVHVPVAERVVTIEGSVQRPYKYELLPGETIEKALNFAGGFTSDAYRGSVLVTRFSDNRQVVQDVELSTAGKTFELRSGDIITVRKIKTRADDYVSIGGAVDLPGRYALGGAPRLTDLIERGVLRRDARRDIAFVLRINPDNTKRLFTVNLEQANANRQDNNTNPLLQPKDSIIIYSAARFSDNYKISITGAVRAPDTFAYNLGLRVTDLVNLAGGLKPEATNFGYVIRTNTENPKQKEYIRVELGQALANPNGAANIDIEPGDRLQVLAKSTYTDIAPVRVSGAVRKPGEFQYSPSLTIRDALTLAGGLRIDGSSNRIDVFRVKIEDNVPTRTLAVTIAVDDSMKLTTGEFPLQPYDQIVVRQVPDFKLQRVVNLEGEVTYPGFYALLDNNEPLSSLIERAGGLTPEAFAEGATLYRVEDKTGYIVTRLDQALNHKRSRYDLPMRDGDILTIPKSKSLVSINIENTNAAKYYGDRFIANGKINVAYEPGKSAKWYINNHAAGLRKDARWRYVTVEDPNGRITKTRRYGVGLGFPIPRKGATISVGMKEKKPEKVKDGKKLDWDKTVSQILALAGTTATLIIAFAALKK